MNDPKRWLHKPNDILQWEQRLLISGSQLKPPAGAEEQAWNEFRALVATLPGSGTHQSGSTHSGNSTSSGAGFDGALSQPASPGNLGLSHVVGVVGKMGASKLAVIVAAIAAGGSLAVFVDHTVSRLEAPPIASTASSQMSRPPPANSDFSIPPGMPAANNSSEPARSLPSISPPTVAEIDERPSQHVPQPPIARQPVDDEQSVGVVAPAGAAELPNSAENIVAAGTLAATASPRLSELRAEATAVAHAKNMISAGQFQAALVQLSQISQRFPVGALAPEREALVIEALAGSGALQSAQQRAAVFLAQYPQSPLVDRIRKIVRAL